MFAAIIVPVSSSRVRKSRPEALYSTLSMQAGLQ